MMLALIMTLVLLAGCGGSQQQEQPGGNGVQDIVDQMNDQLEEQGKINESKQHVGEDEHYIIKNAEDLLAFADFIKEGNVAVKATLQADVDMSGVTWVTIDQYNGEFDGGGNSIKGLTGDGLFHELDEDAVIKNLTLEDVDLSEGGAIADYSNADIENCHVTGKISVTIKSKKEYVGGIIGKMMNSEGGIRDCTSKVDIHCENPDTLSCYVGGIVGITTNGAVENCSNYGTITGNGNYVGGIAGRVEKWASTIRGCVNYGNVAGRYSVGGVVGNGQGLVIDRCGNEGAIEGLVNVGGVVGGFASSDSIWSYVFNCYNHGSVTGTEPVKDMEMQNIAGVVGYNYEGQIVNCYNVGKVTSPAQEKKWDYMTAGISGSNYDSSDQYVYNCYNLGEISGGRAMGFAVIENAVNCYAPEGYERYDTYDYSTVASAGAFADGNVLTGLQGFDGQNMEEKIPDIVAKYEITLSGWVQQGHGPAFDWE